MDIMTFTYWIFQRKIWLSLCEIFKLLNSFSVSLNWVMRNDHFIHGQKAWTVNVLANIFARLIIINCYASLTAFPDKTSTHGFWIQKTVVSLNSRNGIWIGLSRFNVDAALIVEALPSSWKRAEKLFAAYLYASSGDVWTVARFCFFLNWWSCKGQK